MNNLEMTPKKFNAGIKHIKGLNLPKLTKDKIIAKFFHRNHEDAFGRGLA